MSARLGDVAGGVDVDAYLDRIHYAGRVAPDLASLAALHEAHVGSIAFENLDVLWRRPILLDVPSLEAKLVHRRRGGYCFEHNGLFAAVLQALGYTVTPLAARVRYRATRTLARTHMLLLVAIAGTRYVADVGFGGYTLLAPLPLESREPSPQHRWRYRLRKESEVHVLQIEMPEGWLDLYEFTLEPQLPIDYVMANWFVATHPESRFVNALTLQLAAPTARHVVHGCNYAIDRGHGQIEEKIVDQAMLVQLARSAFGLSLPDDVELPVV